MRHAGYFCVAAAAFVFALPSPQTVQALPLGSWTHQATPVFSDLYDVDFADPEKGWAVGQFGVILRTTDAGQTWARQTSPINTDWTAVDALSADHAWALGSDLAMIETMDGGATWNIRNKGGWMLNQQDLRFDGGHGWIAGTNSIFTPRMDVSHDEGATWRAVEDLPSGNNEASLVAVAPHGETAVAVGNLWNGLGYVVRTTDGGETWTMIANDLPPALTGVDIVDGLIGWASGADLHVAPEAGGRVYVTLNGGESWTLQASLGPDLLDVEAASLVSAVAVGRDGTIISTETAGLLWTPEISNSLAKLYAVAVYANGAAWAVGTTGTILHRDAPIN